MNVLLPLGIASLVFVAAFTWRAYRLPAGTGQSPREAIIEAWISIVIGFGLNFALNPLILPLMMHGGTVSGWGNFWGGWFFTAVSLLRQYSIRRWANAHIRSLAGWLAGLF